LPLAIISTIIGISAAVKMALEMARSVMEPIGTRKRNDNNDDDE
jgi:hypothetical protein